MQRSMVIMILILIHRNCRYPCIKEALDCFTNLSCALKERFTDRITRLCNDVGNELNRMINSCLLLVYQRI